jgi:hypothetical protein
VAKINGTAFSLPVSIANGGTGTGVAAGQNDVFAGPSSGGSGAPAFRAITAADVPTLNQNTTGTAAALSAPLALTSGGTGADYASAVALLAGIGALALAGGTLTGWLAPAVVSLSFVGSGTTLVNAALGNDFRLTLTASSTTLGAPSNPVDGQTVKFQITQGTGGSFTLAYASAYDFGAAGSPVLSTAAAKVDVLAFVYNASLSKWIYLGSALGA